MDANATAVRSAEEAGGDGEMKEEKKDRVDRDLRDLFLLYADIHYSKIKDNFISAAKKMAKEKYSIVLDPQLEMLLKAAYQIGFADAMYLYINRDDHDESYGE